MTGKVVINLVVNWLLLFVAAIFILFSLIAYIRYCKVAEEKRIIEIRNEVVAANYDGMARNYRENAQLYHDMKSHIQVINSLLEKGNYEQVGTYIKSISEIVKIKNYTWTGNDIVDCIINIKKIVCEQKGIEMLVDADPLHIELDAYVISTVFSNLLDNAIEASPESGSKATTIFVSVRHINDMVIVKIENQIRETPILVNSHLVTQKCDKAGHGWGIKSVETVVEKVGGVFTYTFDSSKFTAIVTFFV